jgi:hypothetical protein
MTYLTNMTISTKYAIWPALSTARRVNRKGSEPVCPPGTDPAARPQRGRGCSKRAGSTDPIFQAVRTKQVLTSAYWRALESTVEAHRTLRIGEARPRLTTAARGRRRGKRRLRTGGSRKSGANWKMRPRSSGWEPEKPPPWIRRTQARGPLNGTGHPGRTCGAIPQIPLGSHKFRTASSHKL